METFETFETVYMIVSLLCAIISIIFLVRWWKMTTNIRDIRNYLYKQHNINAKILPELSSVEEVEEEDKQQLAVLKGKLKPNQCVVKVIQNGRLEIWSKEDWEMCVLEGKQGKFFVLLDKNF